MHEQNLVQLTAASEHSCLAGLPNDPKLKIIHQNFLPIMFT